MKPNPIVEDQNLRCKKTPRKSWMGNEMNQESKKDTNLRKKVNRIALLRKMSNEKV